MSRPVRGQSTLQSGFRECAVGFDVAGLLPLCAEFLADRRPKDHAAEANAGAVFGVQSVSANAGGRRVVQSGLAQVLAQGSAQAASLSASAAGTAVGRLVEAPEAWATPLAKFKTPWDWLVSSLRALGRENMPPLQAIGALRELGQYECRIVRTPDGAGQYTVEFEPL